LDTSKIKQKTATVFKNKGVLATVGVAALIGSGAIGYAIGDEHGEHHDDFGEEYGMHGYGPHGDDDFEGFPTPPPPGMDGDRMPPPMGVPGGPGEGPEAGHYDQEDAGEE